MLLEELNRLQNPRIHACLQQSTEGSAGPNTATFETKDETRNPSGVKADPDAFVDVTNGVSRERARVALQPCSIDAGEGNVRTIHAGQWADQDDPLVTINPHMFKRPGFE
jgi:hypothetical protein